METIKDRPFSLRNNYHVWHETVFEEHRDLFEDLVDHGQHPETMVLSCCDSRLDITSTFGAKPGDLFIHRNIASLVPTYEDRRKFPGTVAAIEYAVTVLNVKNLVIMGHSQCGGVKGSYDICTCQEGALDPKTSSVGQWVEMLRPSVEAVVAEGPADLIAALEQNSVRFSLRNLHAYPFVAERVTAGTLRIRGFWHDLRSGDIMTIKADTMDIEHL